MPRSGTSLTEQILASHSQVYGAGELTTLRDVVRATYDDRGAKHDNVAVGNNRYRPLHRPAMHRAEELGINYAQQLTGVGTNYLKYVRSLDDKAQRITDKMPYNYFLAPLDFKNLSTGKNHSLPATSAGYMPLLLLSELYRRQRVLVRPGGARQVLPQLLKLMSHWREALQVPMLEVDYEQLVQDPEPAVARAA